MSQANARSTSVDFLRGLSLIAISIDHVPQSLLSHLTLHAYAYCDAAEVFVFLGGYASAGAYGSSISRGGASLARRRFIRRSVQIYRAYLLTAGLMLLVGLAMLALRIHTAALAYTYAAQFLGRPLQTLFDIAMLRSQPYLAAVPPMYMGFALCVPVLAPVSGRRPGIALVASLSLWLCAPALAHLLPSAEPGGWAFNPFAWQLMFVLGMLCRLHPVHTAFQTSRIGLRLTWLALTVALAFATYKLFLESQSEPGYLKQNLSYIRVVSFVSIAWVVAQLTRLGCIDRLASALPSVVKVGRQGLVCFVCGALTSIAADTTMNTGAPVFNTRAQGIAAALSMDALTIAAVLGVAMVATSLKANRRPCRGHRDTQPAPAGKAAG